MILVPGSHRPATMPLSLPDIARRAVESLTPEERRTAAVYLDTTRHAAGDAVRAGPGSFTVPRDGYVAFVDLEPRANWSHRARFQFIDAQRGDVMNTDARFPPFSAGSPGPYRLVHHPPDVPPWTLLTDRMLGG
jgi:hypothetical protein